MFEVLQRWLLRLLHVPPSPAPPFGAPASVRVFRASRKLYLLRLVRWGFAQAGALIGIIFWVAVIAVSEHEAERVRGQKSLSGAFVQLPAGRNKVVLQPLNNIPPALFTWLWVAKGFGLLVYAVQLVVTYTALRLDYQFRWYIVTDRSLRVRWGLWNVQELTMSYANLQQVTISQGPLQRLLGISDVRVHSAGGGGVLAKSGHHEVGGMHSAVFHGIENGDEIRNLIRERLRLFRDSGLGDTDEAAQGEPQVTTSVLPARTPDVLSAARELLLEARRMRTVVSGRDLS